ncbi:MAG TPA: hypothetical protein VM802_30335 [Chitinophaga sp.]|uniref:hypothetical protein n=1 Tax=Chitinophaga sp. TaxID=1869181 RepID=UPI002C3362A7|nr:hypothetical protein [Chitinophaga sp.]HVI49205.1 hypothetical protein [Chitinophaga sp.]
MTSTPNLPQSQEGCTPTKTKATQTRYDYYQLIQSLETHGKSIYSQHFKIDEVDKPVVIKLLAYFLCDEAVATEEGLDLNKGIMLTGRIGCGKTSLMHLMRSLCAEAFRHTVVSCRNISFEFSRTGFDTISKYSHSAFFPYSNIPRTYCFDDLGLETNMNFWGNNCCVMAEILLSRYDLLVSNKMLTHVTTNLNSQELEEIYGNRLRSRMRAMFNLISFDVSSTDKRR